MGVCRERSSVDRLALRSLRFSRSFGYAGVIFALGENQPTQRTQVVEEGLARFKVFVQLVQFQGDEQQCFDAALAAFLVPRDGEIFLNGVLGLPKRLSQQRNVMVGILNVAEWISSNTRFCRASSWLLTNCQGISHSRCAKAPRVQLCQELAVGAIRTKQKRSPWLSERLQSCWSGQSAMVTGPAPAQPRQLTSSSRRYDSLVMKRTERRHLKENELDKFARQARESVGCANAKPPWRLPPS